MDTLTLSTPQAVTYSMIVVHLLNKARLDQGMVQADFFPGCGLTQSSWSRANRGTSYLTLEEVRAACGFLGMDMGEMISEASRLSLMLLQHENIHVLETLKASENKDNSSSIVSAAALDFLISRLSQK